MPARNYNFGGIQKIVVLFLGGIHFYQAGNPPKRQLGKALKSY